MIYAEQVYYTSAHFNPISTGGREQNNFFSVARRATKLSDL